MVVWKLHKVHQWIALQDEGELISSRAPVRHTGRDAQVHLKGYLPMRNRNTLKQWCNPSMTVKWFHRFFLTLMRFIRLEPTTVTKVTQMAVLIAEFGIFTSKCLFEPSSREQYSVKRFKRFGILIRSPELLWANSRLTSDNVAHSGKQRQNRMGRREWKHCHSFSVNEHVFVVQRLAILRFK